jgi:hypothetical protein
MKAARTRTKRRRADAALRCAFGRIIPCGPCLGCRSFARRLHQQFERDVFFGKYDREGFTPRDRERRR